MSEQSQGPGWWLASDGKWYPPHQAPAVPPPETWGPPPSAPPRSSGLSTGAKVGLAVGASIVGLLVLVVAAALFLGGDESSSSAGTGTAIEGDGEPVDVPDGYALIEGDGVTIAAPEDWEEVAPDDFAMSAEEFERAFPNAPAGMFEQGSRFLTDGSVLVAFDLTDGFASNVNVIRAPGEAPLSMVEDEVESQLQDLGARVSAIDRVGLPVGEALRVEYALDVASPDGSAVAASGVLFYVPRDGRTYIVTVTTGGDNDVADLMADTFRVG